jgi:hypothetical protein
MLRLTALFLSLALFSVPAFAKPEGVRWAGTWQGACDEAKDRNVPIIVVFVRQDADGAALEKNLLTGKEFTGAAKKWVTVYCNKDDGQPEKKEKEGDVAYSTLTPGITVEQHKAAWKDLSARLYKSDDATAPSVVWCGPDGEELGRLEGTIGSHDLVTKIAEATKKIGPGLEAGDYVDAIGHLAAAQVAAKDKKTAEEIREYMAVMTLQKKPGSKGVVARAQAGLDRVNAAGKAQLGQANECISAEDYARAQTILKEIIETYRGLPVSKECEKLYDDIAARAKAKERDRIDGGDGRKPR